MDIKYSSQLGDKMKIKNLLIIVLIFFIQISDAKGNKSFKKLQKMQISALDFYLYALLY